MIDLRLHDLVVEQGKLLLQLLSVVQERSDQQELHGATRHIADRLFVGLDELYNGLDLITKQAATNAANGTEPDATTNVAPASPYTYAEVVEHVRIQVSAHVPAGGVVAVVSRGDGALVDFADRVGWHYPQNEVGTWAGYHPRDGADALAHLEALRARGARFLAVPLTSAWWLDWYVELAQFLDHTCTTLVRDEMVALFALPARLTDPVLDLSDPVSRSNQDEGVSAR